MTLSDVRKQTDLNHRKFEELKKELSKEEQQLLSDLLVHTSIEDQNKFQIQNAKTLDTLHYQVLTDTSSAIQNLRNFPKDSRLLATYFLLVRLYLSRLYLCSLESLFLSSNCFEDLSLSAFHSICMLGQETKVLWFFDVPSPFSSNR